MKKKTIMKFCAVALTVAMMGSLVACGGNGDTSTTPSSSTPASSTPASSTPEESTPASTEEEPAGETYDFGGAVVKVSDGIFGDLNEDNSANTSYIQKWDVAHQVEEKYNIKLEYAKLEGDDGWSTQDAILAGLTNGECYADIFCQGDDITLGLRDYLADITDTVDQLEIGSIYVEPGTWNGHTYGWTYDNMGGVYVMAYSRDYLASIGMDKTPTDMFMEGKWSYDDCIQYLTELKSKLPDGTYPMGVHTNHWASMAPAANGLVSVASDGTINLAEEAYASSLDFYRQLLDLGLAYPITDVEIVDGGGISTNQTYGTATLSKVGEPGTHVITMVEAWQMEGLYDSVGEWGIVPWPWDSKYVTCTGDYTTLSDSYKTAQSIWTNVLVPKPEYRSAGAKDIPDIVLHLIAKDFADLANGEAGANARHAMWEAEQAGQPYENYGYNPGAMGSFSTEQDVTLYDWLHTRVVVDWGHAMQSLGYVNTNRNAAYVIANGEDSRSSGESFKQAGEANLAEQGLK